MNDEQFNKLISSLDNQSYFLRSIDTLLFALILTLIVIAILYKI